MTALDTSVSGAGAVLSDGGTVDPSAPLSEGATIDASSLSDNATVDASDSLSDVATIRAAMTRLAARVTDAGRWAGDERGRVLSELDWVVDGLTAVRAEVLMVEREAGAWRGAGDRSFEASRVRTGRIGPRVAAAQVRQASQLAAAPEAVSAVVEGRIGVDHAAVIGAVASGGTPAQREALNSEPAQRELMALAQEQDAGTFATTVARWAATVDPAGSDREHEAQRSERFLQVAITSRGTFLKGRLDSMAGHRLTRALEALSPRPGAEDDRDPGQRRADALDEMARRVLGAADTKPGGHVPPQVTMILTAETWVAARADRDRRRRAALGAGGAVDAVRDESAVGGHGDEPATLEDGTPVPGSVLAAAMCDCEITRIVIDADGVPLDAGRSQRVFTGAQRRAVIARDRECAWPGCHADARWDDIHHIRWWERDGGPTSVENGVLLCSFHHHEVHRRDLSITRVPLPPTAHPPGSPPTSALVGTVARVGYAFRDRAGRVVGGVSATGLAGERATTVADVRSPAGPPPSPTVRTSPVETSGVEPLLEWTTDPFTGARTATLLLEPTH